MSIPFHEMTDPHMWYTVVKRRRVAGIVKPLPVYPTGPLLLQPTTMTPQQPLRSQQPNIDHIHQGWIREPLSLVVVPSLTFHLPKLKLTEDKESQQMKLRTPPLSSTADLIVTVCGPNNARVVVDLPIAFTALTAQDNIEAHKKLTMRKIDELEMHPSMMYSATQHLDLEQLVFQTTRDVAKPNFVMLRGKVGDPIKVVRVTKHSGEAIPNIIDEPESREITLTASQVNDNNHNIPGNHRHDRVQFVSPVHLTRSSSGLLCHVQTCGIGITQDEKAYTAKLYLIMTQDAEYKIQTHSGWTIQTIHMQHHKKSKVAETVQLWPLPSAEQPCL